MIEVLRVLAGFALLLVVGGVCAYAAKYSYQKPRWKWLRQVVFPCELFASMMFLWIIILAIAFLTAPFVPNKQLDQTTLIITLGFCAITWASIFYLLDRYIVQRTWWKRK